MDKTGTTRTTFVQQYFSLPYAGIIIAVVVFYLLFTLITGETYNTVSNQITIMRAAAIFLVVGIGMTFVITTGGIDLSVGSIIGVVGAILGPALGAGTINPYLGILLALLLGGFLGAVNGFNVAVLKIPPLLATLGTMVAYRGITQELFGTTFVTRLPSPIVSIGRGHVMEIPIQVILAGIVALFGYYFLRYSLFGRYITAVGSNEQAAKASRIEANMIKIYAYTFQGILCGLAAIILMGRLNSANAALGEGLELKVIAGVVLGGTFLFGGKGTILGTVIGVYAIGMLENGLIQTGAGFFIQRVVLGALIIISVAFQSRTLRR